MMLLDNDKIDIAEFESEIYYKDELKKEVEKRRAKISSLPEHKA